MSDAEFQATLAEVMESMVTAFEKEREQSDAFKTMFASGGSFAGLLRQVNHTCMSGVLDGTQVLRGRYGVRCTKEVMEFMLAVPYLAYRLKHEIEERDGMCCCVDKTFFLLSEELKRLTGADGKAAPIEPVAP
jgi:hypothetical protein